MHPRHPALLLLLAALSVMLGCSAARERQPPGPAFAKQDLQAAERREIAQARRAIAENRPEDAIDLLAALAPEGLPTDLASDIYALRAQAYSQLNHLRESLTSRMQLALITQDQAAQRRNQEMIWEALLTMPRDELSQWIDEVPRDTVLPWLELALIAKQSDTAMFRRDAALWRRNHPSHPASEWILAEVLAKLGPKLAPTTQGLIAVMLPLHGSLSGPGTAVRDGLLAAYYAEGAEHPPLRFYDTGSEPDTVQSIYQQAVQEQARWIIGPLSKEAVDRLAQAQWLPLPTLALNYTDRETAPERLYQFGLAPEDEARDVAERAWQDGHKLALVLTPQGPWGDRVFRAVEARWSELGGEVTAHRQFSNKPGELSGAVASLLRARQPAQRVRATSDHDTHSAVADVVLMFALPRQARQIPALLRFHHAGDIPVYTTSHGYPGAHDQEALRDMEGVIVCDMPWVLSDDAGQVPLREAIAHEHPESFQQFKRLYALGVDAYRLLGELERLRDERESRVAGVTGMLSLDQNRRVHRHVPCARLADGKALTLD